MSEQSPKIDEDESEECIKVHYIGHDLKFFSKLQPRLEKTYSEKKFKFSSNSNSHEFSPINEFINIINNEIRILFIDSAFELLKCLNLVKLLRKNNATKSISLTVLHDNLVNENNISRFLMAGARINQQKGDEFSGLIFAAMALLDGKEAKVPEHLFIQPNKQAKLIQDLRLSYISTDHFSIETNSPLTPGTEVHLLDHPLKKIIKTDAFKVIAAREENLYYNTRFNLKLEYALEDIPKYEKVIKKWFENVPNKVQPKVTKILLFDETLEQIGFLGDSIENLQFSINVQTSTAGIGDILKRRRPQIIVKHLGNNTGRFENGMRYFLAKVNTLINYRPYFFITNCSAESEKLQKYFDYERILSFPEILDDNELNQLAKKMEKRFSFDDEILNSRIYFSSSDINTIVQMERSITILGMTESVVYFKCEGTIPDYTVFWIEEPIEALITTIPGLQEERTELSKPFYIGIFNYTGEKKNSKLRAYINSLIKADEKAEAEKQQREEKLKIEKEYLEKNKK